MSTPGSPVSHAVSPQQIVTSLASGLTYPRLSAPRATRVLFLGDSGIDGITNGKAGGHPGFFGHLSRALRRGGDDFELVGPYVTTPGTATGSDPQNATPGRYDAPLMCAHGGVSGYKIEDITSHLSTILAGCAATPDVVIVGSVGIANLTAGDSAVTMTGKLSLLRAALRTALPSADLVFCTVGYPPASYAVDSVRATYNTALTAGISAAGYWLASPQAPASSWLATQADARCYVLDTSSDFSRAYLGFLPGPAGDSHPSERGYIVWAERFAAFLLASKAIRAGAPWPPPAFHKLHAQPSIRIISTTDCFHAVLPDTLAAAIGAGSYAIRFDVCPASFPASTSLLGMAHLGWAYDTPTRGLSIFARGNSVSSAWGDVWVYSGSGAEKLLATGVLTVGEWAQIVVSFHASESLMALWINGVLADIETVSPVALDATQELLLGNSGYFRANPGLYDRVEVLIGASVPTIAGGNMRRAVEAAWRGMPLSTATGAGTPWVWYDCNEGTATTCAEGSGGTSGRLGSIASDSFTAAGGTTTWAAANVVQRLDPRSDQLRDEGVRQVAPVRQPLSFGAAASVTTNAAQYIPPAGALTSTTDTGFGIEIGGPAIVISSMQASYTGNAGNNAGQTATIALLLNGSAITGATTSALATTAGSKTSGAITFSPVLVFPGDVLTCSLTPSAGLSNALVDVLVGVG